MRKGLSVIIPSRRGRRSRSPRELSQLVRDILNQRNSPLNDIWVVANPHDRQLERTLNGLGAPVHYLASDLVGANRARNLGLANAQGTIVLFLDDDCRIRDPLFLRRHWDLHSEMHPNASAIGGRYARPLQVFSQIDYVYSLIQAHWLKSNRGSNNGVETLLGGNVSFKAEVVRSHKFCESLVYGGTETELFRRLRQKNHSLVLCESLEVEHDPRMTLNQLVVKGFYQGMGGAFIARHDKPRPQIPLRLNTLAWRPRWLARVFELAHEAGYRFTVTSGRTRCSTPVLWLMVAWTFTRKLIDLRRAPFVTHLYFQIKAALSEQRRLKTNKME